ncbi:NAD-dependent epimerase [Dactylosporangium sp. AC04546]|uniref:NAD-dependent epimerase/dehydratase family protein n=1 Tax=Dactylosporangium sp. AC04546 TaxID=2862460 RepID=UPI001EDEE54D|nr:NAD-dependent epimerase/dehydratase family protein [Dactylosporangium sp. AC04546]WVK84788.1 NAD-dependent epimerase [Dactylosporangium sp. AC04546]
MHVIVGAGSIGTAIAEELAAAGTPSTVVTRSGSGPVHPLVKRTAADVSDAAAFRKVAKGATVIYNCVNPPYHAWPKEWPPISRSMITAAEENDAVLAITGNLYGYGPVDRPMTEDMPLAATSVKGRVRAAMWEEALAAPIRTLEVRASDYIGPRYTIMEMTLPAMRAGKTAWVPGALDVPHSYTYVGDVAHTLVELASDQRAWGKAWHAPTAPPLTAREILTRLAKVAGLPAPRLRSYPLLAVRAAALTDKFVKEFLEVRYQHVRPFVLDSERVRATFGLTYTPLDEALYRTAVGSEKVPSKSTSE